MYGITRQSKATLNMIKKHIKLLNNLWLKMEEIYESREDAWKESAKGEDYSNRMHAIQETIDYLEDSAFSLIKAVREI